MQRVQRSWPFSRSHFTLRCWQAWPVNLSRQLLRALFADPGGLRRAAALARAPTYRHVFFSRFLDGAPRHLHHHLAGLSPTTLPASSLANGCGVG